MHLGGGLDVEAFYLNVEPVVTGPDIVLEGVYGNVFEDFQVSPDNTEFTFTLRKGLKWSDGVPVTVQDVAFVIEDLYFNEEYMDTPHTALRTPDDARTPAQFEILDDWTFKLTFAAPYGSFIKTLALGGGFGSWPSYESMMYPKHYMEQWHPKYADADWLKAELDKANLAAEEWPTLFNQHLCSHWDRGRGAEKCIGFPMLSPYVVKENTAEAITFERNPYYWKVDWEGRQLPYIDEIVSVTVADLESASLLALNGELDSFLYLDLLKAAMAMEMGKEHDYELVLNLYLHADGVTFFFNGCTEDPVLHELFNDIRFRKACSYALDRQEINSNVYLGFGVLPDNLQDSEHSVEKANALLDEIGMTERDANGYRLSPEGEEVKILIEYSSTSTLFGQTQASELFAAHLQAVGINAEPRASEAAVLNERAADHRIQIGVFETYIGATDKDGLFTSRPGGFRWCPEWNWWEASGDPKPEGIPDEFVEYVQAIEDRIQYVPRSPEDAALYEKLLALYRDHLWALISITETPTSKLIHNRLGNTVRTGSASGYFRAMEFLYIKEGY
jgi:peptide/nickel transport system substrate-binding protein